MLGVLLNFFFPALNLQSRELLEDEPFVLYREDFNKGGGL